ncbi:hypothetical protein [Roseovarius pacificus]|nr:hypothetical protein [Roseovarius pacificus]
MATTPEVNTKLSIPPLNTTYTHPKGGIGSSGGTSPEFQMKFTL